MTPFFHVTIVSLAHRLSFLLSVWFADCLFPGSLAADIVAVDVNIRVAFVQFILNDDVLANYRRFLRTIRLHSRPVVMLQKNGFLASVRSGASSFLSSLASTQVCLRVCVCGGGGGGGGGGGCGPCIAS